MRTIEEKNSMIAEFMGASGTDLLGNSVRPKYHTSWDWLMPVVVFINATTEYTVVIQAMDCYVYNVNSGKQVTQPTMKHNPDELISSVYETVIAFIEFYNNQKN